MTQDYLLSLGHSEMACFSKEEQELLVRGLKKYAPSILKQLKSAFMQRSKRVHNLQPLSSFAVAGSQENIEQGEKLLEQGKVGCIVLAGGQATRLKVKAPKGTFQVSCIRKKSLFQILCEKSLACSKKAGVHLSLAIMTSPLNHKETESYLRNHNSFGFPNVDLFSQSMLPCLDESGNFCLKAGGSILEGPDGNGNFLLEFYSSGLWAGWKKKGIEYVNVVLVDNVLADPFDAELVGFHKKEGDDVVVKATRRISSNEKVGVLGLVGDKIKVVEYSELASAEKDKSDIANISLFSFSMDFIEKMAKSGYQLPLHFAQKEAVIVSLGKEHSTKIWKAERFIFDWLDFAKSVGVLVFPREQCYAPLKNAEGSSSLKTVQEALLAWDTVVFEGITGRKIPEGRIFELDPAFYYPTVELAKKWKGKMLPDQDYIEP